MGKFAQWQEVLPVVLPVVHDCSKDLTDGSVRSFGGINSAAVLAARIAACKETGCSCLTAFLRLLVRPSTKISVRVSSSTPCTRKPSVRNSVMYSSRVPGCLILRSQSLWPCSSNSGAKAAFRLSLNCGQDFGLPSCESQGFMNHLRASPLKKDTATRTWS